jgi:transposase
MTLDSNNYWSIPSETERVARAAFSKPSVYMMMRDYLGCLYNDNDFKTLFVNNCGQPAFSPGQLALITVMQFCEGLTDRQTAEAVRARIDWKYALGLELTDCGFNYSILSEFRSRLIKGGRENQLLDTMLDSFKQFGLLKAGGKVRTDSTHVEAAIRLLNRIECVCETLRQALNDLAIIAPTWLLAQVSPDWFERYSQRLEQYRLPNKKASLEQLKLTIGEDGHHLLSALWLDQTPEYLRRIPSVEILRVVWVQQYYLEESKLSWRTTDLLPPNQLLIQSPIDPQARNRTKRDINWTGYMVHLTETCDSDTPNFIINVETVQATTPDGAMTQEIHVCLAEKDLLPKEHFVDTGYIDAQHVVSSTTNYQIDLVGIVQNDSSWQAKASQGFDISNFTVDWQRQLVTCPVGCSSQSWRERIDTYGNQVIEVSFNKTDCQNCCKRIMCTTAKSSPRMLRLKPQEQYQALIDCRIRQTDKEFKKRYQQRAGIEGTLSQACRKFELRRSRYIGCSKTHLQHIFSACAINFTRLYAYLTAGISSCKTPVSPFAALVN